MDVIEAGTEVERVTTNSRRKVCDALVLFGASGDLAKKLVLPSLFNLALRHKLDVPILGVALSDWDDEGMRKYTEASLVAHGKNIKGKTWEKMREQIHFIPGNYSDDETFSTLADRLREVRSEFPLFYLAIPPSFFGTVVHKLSRHGLTGSCRVVIEKPFGRNLESAVELNDTLQRSLEERQIYRMDHFLGKEPVQNLLVFRLANSMVEPIWNNKYIDNVQITMYEDFGVQDRGAFYDGVGAMRDVVQNHLMQIFGLLTMEPPAELSTDAIHDEQVKVFRATRPMDAAEVVRGQYRTYRDTEGVAPHSETETYFAATMWVDSWRWAGVPFHLRAGKELAFTATEAVVTFRNPPRLNIAGSGLSAPPPNRVRFRFTEPDGVTIEMQAKEPGAGYASSTIRLNADFAESLGHEHEPYEILIGAALVGDKSLFGRADSVLRTWEIVDPILVDPPPVNLYEEGTEGPHEAQDLAVDCGGWVTPLRPVAPG